MHGGACGGRRVTPDSLRTGAIGICNLTNVGAGNVTQILYKSAKFSLLLCHLFSPYFHTLIYSYYICVLFSRAYAHMSLRVAHIWRSKVKLKSWLSLPTMCIPGIELRSSGLAAGTLTFSVILLGLAPSNSNNGPEVLWGLGS